MSTEKKGVEASFKSMDTEEFLDIHFNRPIGSCVGVVFPAFSRGYSPNVVELSCPIIFRRYAAGVMVLSTPDIDRTR